MCFFTIDYSDKHIYIYMFFMDVYIYICSFFTIDYSDKHIYIYVLYGCLYICSFLNLFGSLRLARTGYNYCGGQNMVEFSSCECPHVSSTMLKPS